VRCGAWTPQLNEEVAKAHFPLASATDTPYRNWKRSCSCRGLKYHSKPLRGNCKAAAFNDWRFLNWARDLESIPSFGCWRGSRFRRCRYFKGFALLEEPTRLDVWWSQQASAQTIGSWKPGLHLW
jgi:hypothetical protein